MPRRSEDAGIYLLANDRFLQWAHALFNSLELFEPDLPLTLIPYDSDATQVAALAIGHGYSVFADDKLLVSLDEMAIGAFAPRPVRSVRTASSPRSAVLTHASSCWTPTSS